MTPRSDVEGPEKNLLITGAKTTIMLPSVIPLLPHALKQLFLQDLTNSTAFHPLTHDCVAHYQDNYIKFAEDTTVVGLISHNNESAYREEAKVLEHWCKINNLSAS